MVEESELQEIYKDHNDFFVGSIAITQDKLKAFVTCEPQEKVAELTLQDFQGFLVKKIPAEVLHSDVVEDVYGKLKAGTSIERRRVARGKEPEPGIDGKILWLVKRFSPKIEKNAEAEGTKKLDLRNISLFENITAKTIIARIYPPTSGTAGKDVFGKSIPTKAGTAAKIQLDAKSVSLQQNEGYQALVALVDGFASDHGGKASVEQLLRIADVDFHTGSIDFINSVAVAGDVNPGFAVKARQNITINGNTREALIMAEGGDCVIRGFSFGGSQGSIYSGKGITLNVAQDVNAEAREQIIILKEARACQLRSQGPIIGEKAIISGGLALAVCGVQISILGNDVGEPTIIKLCNSIEMTSEYMALVRQEDSHTRAIELLKLHLGPYAKSPERVTFLQANFRSKMEAMIHKYNSLNESLKKLQSQRAEILQKAHENRVLRVNILKKAYPGVVIQHGQDSFTLTEEIKGPCSIEWNMEEKKFVKTELKPLECTWRAEAEGAEHGGAQVEEGTKPTEKE